MDHMDKVKLTCPVFFYKTGKTGVNYERKCKIEVRIARKEPLKKVKTELW